MEVRVKIRFLAFFFWDSGISKNATLVMAIFKKNIFMKF
jgi:hypothetical protein